MGKCRTLGRNGRCGFVDPVGNAVFRQGHTGDWGAWFQHGELQTEDRSDALLCGSNFRRRVRVGVVEREDFRRCLSWSLL